MYEDYNPAWYLPIWHPEGDYNPLGVVTICGINLEVMDDDNHGFWFVRIIDPDDEKYICNGCGGEHTWTIDFTLCCINCETLYCHNCDDKLTENDDGEPPCCKDSIHCAKMRNQIRRCCGGVGCCELDCDYSLGW